MKAILFVLLITLIVCSAHAKVYSDSYFVSASLKYDNGVFVPQNDIVRAFFLQPSAGEMLYEHPASPEVEIFKTVEQLTTADAIEKDLVNVIILEQDDDTFRHNLQTSEISDVFLKTRTVHDFDVLQVSDTTVDPTRPYIEIYWNYDVSPEQPWTHYLRINKPGDTEAILSDFKTKVIWKKGIDPEKIRLISETGVIPEWGSI